VSDVCLIVDANVAPSYLAQPSAVIAWLLGERGNPKLVAAGKLLEELALNADVRRRLVTLERAGRLRPADAEKLDIQARRLHAAGRCTSNDHHILALAIVSGARTLAPNDNALAADFKNKRIVDQPRGRVYRDREKHWPLLCHTKSCGIDARPKRRSG
jgi:hypothetical protein